MIGINTSPSCLLNPFFVTPVQFFREQDTNISHIRLTIFDWSASSVLMITFVSSWADLFSQLSLLPDLKHCVPFFSTCLVSTCCVVKTSPAVGTALLCSRVLGSRSLAVLLHGFSGPFRGCFSFFTAIWHVFQPTYNSPPWSESKRCPRSLQTALLWTSHK